MANITLLGKNIAIALSMVMLLGACQEKPDLKEIEAKLEQKKSTDNTLAITNETLKAIDQSLSGANKASNAKDIKFSTVSYTYELPKSMQDACNFNPDVDNGNQKISKPSSENSESDFCTKIDIELAKIEPIWMEQVVNKAITNDDNPKLIKFTQSVDDFVKEHLTFIDDSKETAKENGEDFVLTMSYLWYEKPELLPAINNIAQIVIHSDIYMGGAHGVQNANYLIFDMDLQSQINLGDVIIKGKEDKFYELAYNTFKDYLKSELELSTPKQIKEYEKSWEFTLAENFYFNTAGLVLVYQPYELGSYAQGFIKLTLPYEALKEQGLLKPQYLMSQTAP